MDAVSHFVAAHGVCGRLFLGVIPIEKQGAFERMIFRMSRGNAVTR